ncbi:MAG: S41 family peptidase [Nannocystaceae bacterium]
MRYTIPLFLMLTGCGPSSSANESVPPASKAEPRPAVASACPPVAFPDGPAGQRLAELVAATNSPELALAEAVVSDAMTDEVRARYGSFVLGNAGDELSFELCRVDFVAPTAVVATLGGANPAGEYVYGVLAMSLDDEDKVAAMAILRAAREDLEAPVAVLDEAAVRDAVEGFAEGLGGYVFADKADAMAKRIRNALQAGEYAGVVNGHLLALQVSGDLFAVTGDKHLEASYHLVAAEPPRDQTPEELEAIKKLAVRDNFGMPVAEIRNNGVAYLKVLGFVHPDLGAEPMSTTMSKLADAKALIIDLRENGGGSSEGVAYMASYLFGEEAVHLNDIYNR